MWQEYGESVSEFRYRTQYYTILRKDKPWLKECHQLSVLSGAANMEKAFQRFFRGEAAYPRPADRKRPSGQRYNTPNDHQSIHLDMIGGLPYISVPKVGKVRFVMPYNRTIESMIPDGGTRITSVTVIHDGGGYSVSLQMESIVDLVHPVKNIPARRIGAADLGISDFATFGDIENTLKEKDPKWIGRASRKLRRLQRTLSRKYEAAEKEGRNYWEGKNYQKAKAAVAKQQRHIANQRKDFHHKLSNIIARLYDVFIFEDLNIKGMVKNRHLAKAISDAGWYQFRTYVTYKLERKGGTVITAGRFFASSQKCSECGAVNPEVKDLKVREWICPDCGTKHDRDVNAKENLLQEGMRLVTEAGITII